MLGIGVSVSGGKRQEKEMDEGKRNERPKAIVDMLKKIRLLKIKGKFINSTST